MGGFIDDHTGLGLGSPGNQKDVRCMTVRTALGDLPTDPNKFVTTVLEWALSLAGTIAVILMLIAGYQLMTSQGDKQKLQNARERITSLIIGLLFIIFSLVILQFIARDLLRIPGFL